MMFLFAMLLLSAVSFADAAPGGSCYCCGPTAILLILGALFLFDGEKKQ